MATSVSNTAGSSNPSNFNKEHYNHLINTIKWVLGLTGGAISIIVAVALGFTWKDRNEYREEVKTSLSTHSLYVLSFSLHTNRKKRVLHRLI